ncbi:AraC family transcriptional regulator [Actinoplanes sp. TBRC 11911]|uniref:AraC-like ligand-binding domain-containing protein n=1 Tax=Actinoplanes sp. TBRC 11911 TaxID=2729386 RepID=UPI00145E2022|nr:helix-turn-helix domain-containing protein [Actinoplanes sp. TBRC 11911]NMO49672.1 AraC family transcriptional regulator [Actinoplanes sp. TBRC 11911]
MALRTSAFPVYREAINETFVPLSATPLGAEPFHADLDPRGGFDLQITRVRASAQRVRRTETLIDDAEQGFTLATIQVAGRCTLVQDGRTALLNPGDLVFADSTRPFGLTCGEGFEQIVVQVPRTRVDERVLRRGTAVLVGDQSPASAIVAFFRALAGHDPAPLGSQALSLFDAALDLAAGAGRPTPALDRERVLDYLRHAFRDPYLDAESVAHACHLSRRQLFRLFAGEPLSLADELRRIRVAEARRLIRARPANGVTGLAAACGFASETQLRRAFRSVTGTTPGADRADVLAQAGAVTASRSVRSA